MPKGMKHCAHCSTFLPLSDFRMIRKVRGGPLIPRYICRGCEKHMQAEYYARKKTGSKLDTEADEFRQIQPWPWAPGEKVFA